MNNEMITTIRNSGIATIFPDGIPSNLIQIDSGKWAFRVDDEHWVGITFTVKKEDYTPDWDAKRYANKVRSDALCKARNEAIRKEKAEAKATRKAKTE